MSANIEYRYHRLTWEEMNAILPDDAIDPAQLEMIMMRLEEAQIDTLDEIDAQLQRVPAWEYNGESIVRTYTFDNFVAAAAVEFVGLDRGDIGLDGGQQCGIAGRQRALEDAGTVVEARAISREELPQWLAERWDRKTYGTQTGPQITLNITDLRLNALRHAEVVEDLSTDAVPKLSTN